MKTLRIATRKSRLALAQTQWVADALKKAHPDLTVEVLGFTTTGDRIQDVTLSKVGGKGLFTKELEEALLQNKADIAVHSMKDMPAQLPEGLAIRVICQREDPRDAFVSNTIATFEASPQKARIGTSSLRRQCQLKAWREDIVIDVLRGNVDTRLRKLDEGQYDAIILAAAGLNRLALPERITAFLPTEKCTPAVAQGAVGIETREGDEKVYERIKILEHPPTRICVTAERAMNAILQGNCQVPIGGHAEILNNTLQLTGMVGYPDGHQILKTTLQAPLADAEGLGERVAEDLFLQGAREILQAS